MAISLSDKFSYRKLLKFTLPSVIMMVFSSIYGVVDGLFISNMAGTTQFAAVNFIIPFLMVLGAFGFMFGAGGSALVAKTLGEGDRPRANRYFSMLIYITIGLGVVLAVLGIIFIRPVAVLLGAEGEMVDYCVRYGRIILLALPAFMLQMEFQSFMITAEKPAMGLWVTVAAGVANMVFDALFVGLFRWDVEGAAAATAISQIIGGIVPLIYFFKPENSLIRLTKANFDGKAFVKSCVNGSSEFMSQISMSIVSMLYNAQLLKYAGEDGVSSYGVLMYVGFTFIAIFIGYSIGSAPIIGYHYGAKNHDEVKSVLGKSLVIIAITAVCMFVLSECFSPLLSKIFVGKYPALYEMTCHAFVIYSFSFLFSGFAIYTSGFFTALNDGVTSAIISFMRTLVFQVSAVLILPLIWELDGIWISIVIAEVMAVIISAIFLVIKRKKFHY